MTALNLGVIGLGMAGAVMVRAAARHDGVVLVAGADPHPGPRDAFARDFNARAYADAAALVDDPAVAAVYIATPHQFHAAHAIMAAERGKHVILEKPMALTLADCDRIIAAVERAGVHLVVGHTHAFDSAVRAMRALIASGDLGRLGMLASWNYTNYLYRPRRPEELDTSKGGGILFNQVPHQIDTVRLLGGGLVKSVRAQAGILDPERPTEANCAAFLEFADGVPATLVYSGYDFFDTDELHFWISERGAPKTPAHGAARRALAERKRHGGEEAGLRTQLAGYGSADEGEPPHQPHFGLTIATCARGDLRASADGVFVYGEEGRREIALPGGGKYSGRHNVLDDLREAIRTGAKPVHDGRWGKATVEVALAIQQSARERREIILDHQVAVTDFR
ncbi:MAG TPA: Gfo/Idh/MocA family oxidoreductase [Xanthobacteraceae bacterium]|nr:Gfo/Idh/MocA family oxidoreductase [Xanthobacteraceae bacterium]